MENISIQQKIDNWLKANKSYAAKPKEEIISAMLAANVLTPSEAQEISVFGVNTIQEDVGDSIVNTNRRPKKNREEVLKDLEIKIISLALQVEQVEKDNSFVESAWSWFKDKAGWYDSLENVKKALQHDIKLFEKLKNNENIDFQKDDCPYSGEEIDLLLEGRFEFKSQKALNAYKEGQEMASDMFGDLTSGIGAVCLYSAIVLTGGLAAIPTAIGTAIISGGAIKVGTKAIDNLGSEKKYDSLGKDLLTGGFSGLLAPITAGIGGAVGKCFAKTIGVQATKTLGKKSLETGVETGFKQMAKNALLNPAGYTYHGAPKLLTGLASGVEMGVDGALGGGLDGAYRAALEGEDVGEAFIYGSAGGLVFAPAIGGGFKLAGKGASKIAEKIWATTDGPALTTPNKQYLQASEPTKLKNLFSPEVQELAEKLKKYTYSYHTNLL